MNWLPGFEVVVQCVEKLVELLGSFELGLGMNTPTHMCMDQIPGMDHPFAKCFFLENLELLKIFFCCVPTLAVAHQVVE